MEFEERATTAIHIRVKRFEETYFLLCDEYETVESLKGRLLAVLQRIKFELPKQEEALTTDDLKLCIKNRVSYFFIKLIRRYLTQAQLAMINKYLMTLCCMSCLESQAPRMSLTSWRKWQSKSSNMSTPRNLTPKKPSESKDYYR